MLFSLPFEPRQLEALALATAIGLLMGLERERRPAARAGVRTFGLTGLLGALSALLAELLSTPAFIVAGFVLVAVMIISANLRQAEPDDDPGTTSVIALLVCYSLGAMVWLGHGRLAVMAAVLLPAFNVKAPAVRWLPSIAITVAVAGVAVKVRLKSLEPMTLIASMFCNLAKSASSLVRTNTVMPGRRCST